MHAKIHIKVFLKMKIELKINDAKNLSVIRKEKLKECARNDHRRKLKER